MLHSQHRTVWSKMPMVLRLRNLVLKPTCLGFKSPVTCVSYLTSTCLLFFFFFLWPASWALSARSAQRTINTKPTKPPHSPTVPAALRGSAWVRAYICGGWVSLRMRHHDVLRGTKELGGNSREAVRRELMGWKRESWAEGYVSMATRRSSL